jgi:hypothetical protein
MGNTATKIEINDSTFPLVNETGRLAYIKPTGADEARRLGIIPFGIDIPDDLRLYVLHDSEGRVLGFTDDWDATYRAALENELTPLSIH